MIYDDIGSHESLGSYQFIFKFLLPGQVNDSILKLKKGEIHIQIVSSSSSIDTISSGIDPFKIGNQQQTSTGYASCFGYSPSYENIENVKK